MAWLRENASQDDNGDYKYKERGSDGLETKTENLDALNEKLALSKQRLGETEHMVSECIQNISAYIKKFEDATMELAYALDASGVLGDWVTDNLQAVFTELNLALDAVSAYEEGNYEETAKAVAQMIKNLMQLHDDNLRKTVKESQKRVTELGRIYSTLEDKLKSFGYVSELAAAQATKAFGLLQKQLESIGSSLSDTTTSLYSALTDGSEFLETLKENITTTHHRNLKKKLREIYSEVETALQAVGYNTSGGNSAYMVQYANLIAQRAEIERQIASEEHAKKTDEDTISDLQSQLSEINEEIMSFMTDLMAELYSMDFTSWASSIGDALMNAFREGEDAAEAFEDTVNDIMADVANDILRIALIEPMMNEIQEAVFGVMDDDGNYSGGMLDLNDLSGTVQDALAWINSYFSEKGSETIEAYQALAEQINEALNGALTATSSSGLTASITSISEETADVLAAYINAMRADVSVERSYIEQLVGEQIPQLSAMAQAQLNTLKDISTHTSDMAERMAELNDLMADVTRGTKYFYVK